MVSTRTSHLGGPLPGTPPASTPCDGWGSGYSRQQQVDHRVGHPSPNQMIERLIDDGHAPTLGRVSISAGKSNPLHIHNNCIEVVTLLSGRLLHAVGDDTFEMEAGDVLAVAPGLPHRAEAIGGADAEMVIAYPSGRRAYEEGG